jgi:hypothetical protein
MRRSPNHAAPTSPWFAVCHGALFGSWSEKGDRLAQQMQVGPCIPVGMQLWKAVVGPTFGPTWQLSYLVVDVVIAAALHHDAPGARLARGVGAQLELRSLGDALARRILACGEDRHRGLVD